MPIVKYIEPDGAQRQIDVDVGNTVMQGAMDNMVEGMLAECGGCVSCATCHCYVDDAWIDSVKPADETETEMLDCVTDRRPNSRLGCQIVVSEKHEGLTIQMPDSPY